MLFSVAAADAVIIVAIINIVVINIIVNFEVAGMTDGEMTGSSPVS